MKRRSTIWNCVWLMPEQFSLKINKVTVKGRKFFKKESLGTFRSWPSVQMTTVLYALNLVYWEVYVSEKNEWRFSEMELWFCWFPSLYLYLYSPCQVRAVDQHNQWLLVEEDASVFSATITNVYTKSTQSFSVNSSEFLHAAIYSKTCFLLR